MQITSEQRGRQKLAVGTIVISALVLITVLITGASRSVSAGVSGENEKEMPITGQALEQASAAALKHTGQGTVSSTEVGDEESYYQIEVTQEDGDQVDVQIDQNFNYVSQKTDHPDQQSVEGNRKENQ